MKFIFLISILFCINLNAQPTIKRNNYPLPGDTYTYYNADTSFAWSHVKSNWDFNYLTYYDTLKTVKYLSVTNTPYDTAYSNCNLASTSDMKRFEFFIIDNNKYERIGTAIGNEISKFPLPIKIMVFPFGNKDSYSNTFSSKPYNVQTSGATYSTVCSGLNKTSCDSIGTLKLGNIEYNNILRVHSSIAIFYDYSYNGAPYVSTTQEVETYSWQDGLSKFPLLEYQTIKTINSWDTIKSKVASLKVRDGLLTSTSSINDKVTPLLFEIKNKSLNISNTSLMSKIEIFQLNGQKIIELHNQYNSFIPDLPIGIYIAKIYIKNEIVTRKVAIQ